MVSHALTNEFLFLLQQLLSLEGNRGEHVSACARARERGRQGDRESFSGRLLPALTSVAGRTAATPSPASILSASAGDRRALPSVDSDPTAAFCFPPPPFSPLASAPAPLAGGTFAGASFILAFMLSIAVSSPAPASALAAIARGRRFRSRDSSRRQRLRRRARCRPLPHPPGACVEDLLSFEVQARNKKNSFGSKWKG